MSYASARKNFENAIAALERQRRSRIFSLIHTAEPQHICQPEFWYALSRRQEFSRIDTLEILIHSPGGHASVSYRLAQYFKRHCKKLHILVPMRAKSAATLLCLNADAIFMGEFAELGPLDVQLKDELEKGKDYFSPLDEFKSVEFLREYATGILDYLSFTLEERGLSVKQALHESMHGMIGMMNPLYSHIDPARLGSYRRALAEGEEYAKRLLNRRFGEDAPEVAEKLVWDYPAHDFVIDYEEATAIALPVQRLPIGQEKALISAILGLMDYEAPYVGFATKRTPRKGKATKTKAPRRLPTAINAATRASAS